VSDLEPSGLTFTKPELTAINGEPTPATMTLLQSELNGNTISVASNRGGGQFGHLALTLLGADYLAVAHEAFVTPPNPGDTPIHGEAPTAHQITESNRAFLAAKSEYKLYLAVGQALKKELLAAVGDIYVNELAHPTLRYATVPVRNLLAHLFLTYGQSTLDQLKASLGPVQTHQIALETRPRLPRVRRRQQPHIVSNHGPNRSPHHRENRCLHAQLAFLPHAGSRCSNLACT